MRKKCTLYLFSEGEGTGEGGDDLKNLHVSSCKVCKEGVERVGRGPSHCGISHMGVQLSQSDIFVVEYCKN